MTIYISESLLLELRNGNIPVEEIIKKHLNNQFNHKGVEFAVNITNGMTILDSINSDSLDLFGTKSVAFELDGYKNLD